jgi:TRAP transporter TAXI family solute receptor
MKTTSISRASFACVPRGLLAVALVSLAFGSSTARAQDAGGPRTVDAGPTGFDLKRPVLASACEHGCPWGELGDFVKEAMEPFGYDVVLCRNCNRDQGPRLVSTNDYPPPLGIADTFVGTTERVNARVDFGITSSGFLAWAYTGSHAAGPFDNLRLIAKIDDPSYLLVAVKVESGITDLSQIAEKKMPVTILGGGSPISQPILDHYGLTQEAVTAWGGVFHDAITFGQAADPEFDVIINENASPANNPESAYWTKVSQKHDLRFLDVPESVLSDLASDKSLAVTRATVKWGFLRGVDRPIPTLARSGHVVFARDDMPEQAAYDAAKAVDEHRAALKWFIRPYSYDSRAVWDDFGVPLHPGAERYYREMGYMPRAATATPCPDAARATDSGGGCNVSRVAARGNGSPEWSAMWIVVLTFARRVRQRLFNPGAKRVCARSDFLGEGRAKREPARGRGARQRSRGGRTRPPVTWRSPLI